MKRMIIFSLLMLMLPGSAASQQTDDGPGWVSLFDGKTLDGWKASQFGDKSFTVQDGAIVANGRSFSHLFYVGKVNEGEFKNFEFKADVLTRPNSNGGIYFHTRFRSSVSRFRSTTPTTTGGRRGVSTDCMTSLILQLRTTNGSPCTFLSGQTVLW